MRLIVGLGNPGRAYAHHRHNVGFQCVALFAKRHGIALNKRRLRAQIGSEVVAGERIVLARPQTFMNRSGEAVRALMRNFGMAPADLLVICDDLALPLGKIRLRPKGSAGGHNGMKSIIAAIGTQDFPRLRIGIAPTGSSDGGHAPHRRTRTPSYVLSGFNSRERGIIQEVRSRVADAIYCFLAEGIEKAMNEYNQGPSQEWRG